MHRYGGGGRSGVQQRVLDATWGDPKDYGLRKLLTLLRILMVWCSQKEVLRFRTFGGLSLEEF